MGVGCVPGYGLPLNHHRLSEVKNGFDTAIRIAGISILVARPLSYVRNAIRRGRI
jgi:hypothetical protein